MVYYIVVCIVGALIFLTYTFWKMFDRNYIPFLHLHKPVKPLHNTDQLETNTTKSVTSNNNEKLPNSLTLAEKLNLRYNFANIKINEHLSIMTWKNSVGKRLQSTINVHAYDAYRRACNIIEDSMYDTKKHKPKFR